MSRRSDSSQRKAYPSAFGRYYEGNDNRLRPVTVRVDEFTGYGRHIHVTIKEADDPYWDPEKEAWVLPEDPEDEGHGRERVMKFNSRETARRWIDRVFSEEFSAETHALEVEEGASREWFYGDGD